MNHVLKKKIDNQWFFLILTGFVLVSVILKEGSAFREYAPYAAGFIVVFYGALLYLDVRRPAAAISGDVLTIYGRYGQASVVEKSKLRKFEYACRSSSHHEIYVEMEGYKPWTINVTEKYQHLEDERLYNFINNNFWKLNPNK